MKTISFLRNTFGVFLAVLFILPATVSAKSWQHPSGMHFDEQIELVKKEIKKGNERYVKAQWQLLESADRACTMGDHALEDFTVPGYYVIPDLHRKNSQALQTDSFNAYACALAYVLSGNEKYAKKATELLNQWARINKKYSDHDGVLVMSYSGTGLVIAAGLLRDYKGWNRADRAQFETWIKQVYREACNEIRNRKNNWADWGRLGSILCANYLNDDAEVAENIRLIKSDLFHKIAADGSMPEETRRGNNGIWYTYFSLAPITAACWVAYQRTGENLFLLEEDGKSIKMAMDYLFYYNQHPDEWIWFDGKLNQGRPSEDRFWPGVLMEAMGGLYEDQAYIDYVKPHRPIYYGAHHYAWVFPTLMPVWFK